MRLLASDVARHVATKGRPSSLKEVATQVRLDPWGRTPLLEVEGDALRVRSIGPDGRPNTNDDHVLPVPR